MKNNVLVIVGPTAIGKTAISIELAKRLNGEIISADSMQIYKCMDIGTAKPSLEEMQEVKHYLIDVVEPYEEFSVAKFKDAAGERIEDVIKNGKFPIVVGGTGLYINSLIDNVEFSETITDWDYRNELEARANKEGIEVLYYELKEIDPESAKKIHPNDLRRIIRALEVYKYTGRPISYHKMISKQTPSKYEFIMVGLNMERSELYKRIDLRVEKMIENGLVDEVRTLVEMGIGREHTAMQGLGYKEIFEYLQGEIEIDEAVEIIKRDSRRYAKRQLTWFRRDKRINWFDASEGMENNIKKIVNYIEDKSNILYTKQ